MTIRSKTFLAVALACAAGFTPATGAFVGSSEIKGVVELFTSQGCSSCPPADKVLAKMAKRDDVVVLGYHVDYWDYLGWKDSFGSPENTARQYSYRASLKTASVYTPQAVLNGAAHANGSDDAAIADATRKPLPLQLTVKKAKGSVTINVPANVPAAETSGEALHVILVRHGDPQSVAIGRGENGGRDVFYANPVVGYQTLGMWHGEPAAFELPDDAVFKDGASAGAVLVQRVSKDGTPGAILGAARIER